MSEPTSTQAAHRVPALQPRDQAWRLLAVTAFSGAVWATLLAERTEVERVVDVALGLLALVLVVFRRHRPLTIALATTALAAVSALAAGPSTLAMVSLATGRRWVQIAAIGVASVVGSAVFVELEPAAQTGPRWLILGSGAVLTSATLAWGMYIGSRRELLSTLRHRAEAAESERDLRAARARLEERSRIAREMHDVLAHRISQISVSAGALSYREDLSREEMRESATVIRESAHLALTDLRVVLGVLRESDVASTEPTQSAELPQPTYADVPELVETARRSGLHVRLTDRLGADPVPQVLGRTLFRFVQESMTNAQKHATGAAVEIALDGGPEAGLTVVARNALGFTQSGTPGSGLGLVGLAERVQLHGGRLDHGREGSDFVVRAWIPWTQ